MVSVERYPCFVMQVSGVLSLKTDAVFSNVEMKHVPCSLLKKNTIVLWSATSWRLTKCLNKTTFLYMWLRGNLEFVVVQLHVKSRTSLFRVKRRMSMTSATSFSGRCMARQKWRKVWRRRREERVETVAEAAPCCRETEESDEMHKTEQFFLLHA